MKLAKFAIPLCLLSVILTANVVVAQNISPGVQAGDSFIYRFYTLWISSSPESQAPTDLVSLNETNLIRVVIDEVCGVVVVMNVTRCLRNGTELFSQIFVNILNGAGEGFGLVIAPNLTENSFAYHMGFDIGNAFLIKESMVKAYPFGEREVLHAKINQTGSSTYARITHDIYFDRKTGAMLEWRIEQTPYTDPTAKAMLVWEIMEFHVKAKEEELSLTPQEPQQSYQGLITLALILVIVIVTVLLIYLRKHKRLKIPKPR